MKKPHKRETGGDFILRQRFRRDCSDGGGKKGRDCRDFLSMLKDWRLLLLRLRGSR